jgi:hypothetical protein
VESLVFFAICRNDPFTMRESPYLKSWPWQIWPVIGLAAVLGVIGPFGSYDRMLLGTRLAYFLVIGILNWLQVILLAAWLARFETIGRWPVAARMILVGVIVAVPSTYEVILALRWIAHYRIPFSAAPHLYPENAFLTTSLAVVFGLFVELRRHEKADVERARVAELPPEPSPAPPGPTDFFRRIPPALGHDLLALEMEDHYLRIHTAVGSDLILLRLRDAMTELGPARGRQVHRSWWVAEGAVSGTEKAAGRTLLVLRNGLKVPVSKSFRDPVKEAGWLG